MNPNTSSRDLWDMAAKRYSVALTRSELFKIYMPSVWNLLGDVSGKRVLDAGCGDGRYSLKLAAKGASVCAIDASPAMLTLARQNLRAQDVTVRKADLIRRLPFLDNEFDVVLSNLVLMDLPQIDRPIRELSRVLKRGGLFVFTIVHPCFFPFDWTKRRGGRLYKRVDNYLQGRAVVLNWWGRTMHYHRPLSEYFRALQRSGFAVIGFDEPAPRAADLRKHPEWSHHSRIPSFLVIAAHKVMAP